MNKVNKIFLAIVIFCLFIFVSYFTIFNQNFGFKRYMTGELVNISYPETSILVEALNLKTQSITHWNQFSSAGSPTISQSGIYYLPNYLLKIPYLFDQNFLSFDTYQYFVLLHLLFAAVGMFLLLKRKLISNPVAIFGGMFFIVSGFMIEITWVNYIFAASLLPWILLLFDLSKSKQGYPWILLASFLAFQQFAVNPQFALYSLIFIALLGLIQGDFKNFKGSVRYIVFCVLTLLYSAVLLIPLKEFNLLASYQNYLNYNYIDMMATRAIDIFQIILFAPSPNFAQLFSSVISIIMVVILFVAQKNKSDYKLLGIALLLFLFSTDNMLFLPLVRLVPFLNEIRWFSRVNELIVFILLLLALKSISNYKPDFKRDSLIAGVLGIIAILGFLLGMNYDPQGYSVNQIVFPLMLIGIFVLFLYGWREKFIDTTKLKYLIGFLILFDLSRSLVGLATYQFSLYQLDKAGQVEGSEWFLKGTTLPRREKSETEYRIPADRFREDGYNKFLLTKEYAGGSTNRVGYEFSPAVLKSYDDYLETAKVNTALLTAANISYGAGALPRSYLISCYKYALTERDALLQLADLDFSGGKYIILNDKPNSPDIPEISNSKECPSSYTNVQFHQTDDMIVYDSIVSSKAQILFISDNWYPGWNVYINGQKAKLLKANYTFKAVEIPAGNSEVVFKFEPQSIRTGGLVTWISIIGSILFIIFQFIWNVMKRKKAVYEKN